MRKLFLLSAVIILSINSFGQCLEMSFNPTEDDYIVKEIMGDLGADLEVPWTVYLKYITSDDDLIIIDYTSVFEFSDSNRVLFFEDQEIYLNQRYLKESTCNREVFSNGKKDIIYTRTYIFSDIYFDEEDEPNIIPEEAYVTSKDIDFKEILTVTTKHNLGYTHIVVVPSDEFRRARN